MEAPVACALCDSLGSNAGNVLPNTGEAREDHARVHFTQSKILDDGIAEDEVFQRCFTNRKPKVERQALSHIECHQSLLDLCTSLIKQQTNNKKRTADCNMCGLGIRIGNEKYNLVKHACAHLEFKVFKCRHCDRASSTGSDIRQHIRRWHGIEPTSVDLEDTTVEHFDEIFDWVKRCFSTSYPRASGLKRRFVTRRNCLSKSQRSIADFCRYIFIQRTKPTSIDCNLCGLRISLVGRNGYYLVAMSGHASTHLADKLFTCRHCKQSVSSKLNMKSHLKNTHQITDGNSDDFDDHSDIFHSACLDMIERCFSGGQVKQEVPSTNDIRAIKNIRNRFTGWSGSELTVKRHLFCNRLIREVVDSDGKIKCALCSKRLVAKSSDHVMCQAAFRHADMHLQKPLYRCKVCKASFSTQSGVLFHLKSKHALGLEKNHECVADEFHEEIMAMLSKCFAA